MHIDGLLLKDFFSAFLEENEAVSDIYFVYDCEEILSEISKLQDLEL